MIIYKILSIIFFPLIALYICIRALNGKENKSRLKERFGYASIKRPQGEIIWVHAVSVGEANSALILVEELLKISPRIKILFTTTTITSAAILVSKINAYQGRVIHQFLPIDSYFVVKKFLKYWHPRAALFVESEIWPNFITVARSHAVSSFLINARISKKSFSRWLFAKKIAINIFDYFAFIFTQSLEDKERLRQLTKQEILFYGNLKSQADNLNYNEDELKNLQQAINSRKYWLAASTHKGEEEIIIAAHKKLKQKFPNLLTIIIPRHPVRAEEIKALLASTNFAQRSKNQEITDQTEIYFADTLGELGLFYKLCNFAFIAGSLTSVGGHNPYEAIKLDCAIITGIHTFNFKEIYEKLEKTNSCIIVKNENELCDIVERFLNDKNIAKTQLQNAKNAIADNDDTAKRIVKRLDEFLLFKKN